MAVRAHNAEVADRLDELGDLLELLDENVFRVRAYRRAAEIVRSRSRDVGESRAGEGVLESLPGIGADLAGKIRELAATGTCDLLRQLRRRVPRGRAELLRLPGLGPKLVRRLDREHGISSPSALARALARGAVTGLPGPTTASGRRLAAALARRDETPRVLRSRAAASARALVACLQETTGVRDAVVAGSFRRGRETVGDLDLLAASTKPVAAIEAFCTHPEVARVVAHGRTRAAVVLASGLQVDLRVVAPDSFGAALCYFTGSKPHNLHLRRLALAHGLKLNEYGLYRGTRRIAGATEQDVYAALGMPWIPPELREDTGEIDDARADRLPILVERRDLRGDLHVHTDASDGTASLEAMVAAARDAGLEYVGIADHARFLGITGGLDGAALARQARAIDALAARRPGIEILKGVEVEIRPDGTLALPDEALAPLDYAIAAVHTSYDLPAREQTRRLLRALEHPRVAILAHPRARLIGERAPLEFDLDAVLAKAAERGVFVELNCQPSRLDLPAADLRVARARGVRVAVGSDAHHVDDFALLEPGLLEARRAGCTRDDVSTTRSCARVRQALTGPRGDPARRTSRATAS